MRKILTVLCLFSALPLALFGQGVAVAPQTALKTVNGVTQPFAGATITVCAASTGGIPCSPALSNAVFKDVALTQPLSNPFTADTNGNYSFAIAPGTYTVTVTGSGFSGFSYQITASSGTGGGSSNISGLTSGQVGIAGSATSITSSKAIQGTDSKLLSSDGSSSPGAPFCQDASGGATISGCSNGLSGMTSGQVPVANSPTSINASKAIQGTDSNLLSAGTVSGTSALLCTDANGGATTTGCSSSPAFSGITSGTNSSAAMTVGTGASLGVSGSGTIGATSVPFSGVNAGTNTQALAEGTGGSHSASGVGQIAGTQLWLPYSILTPGNSLSTSGGSLNSNPFYYEVTFNTAAGETYPSYLTSLSMGSCVTSCQVTITAPTLPAGVTGYTVYDCQSGSTCTPLRQTSNSACVNITGSCVVNADGAGSAAPTSNTAWVQPPNVQTNECPGGTIPMIFTVDQSGNFHTAAGVDLNSNNSQTSGTLEFCRRTWFTDMQATPPGGNNAFMVIDHNSGTGTSLTNQDRALWINHRTPNGSTTTYYGLEGIQVEFDVLATGSGFGINGSPDGELTSASFQVGDTATANYSTSGYNNNVIRAQYFKNGVGASGPYSIVNAIFSIGQNTFNAGTQAIMFNGSCSNGTSLANNLSCIGYKFTPLITSLRANNGNNAIYVPNVALTPVAGGDYLVRNDLANYESYLNGLTVVSGLQTNNVASLPVTGSVSVAGSITGTAATAPAISSVTCSGGSSLYTYVLVGVDGNGGTVAGSAVNSTSTCTNPLTSGNPVTVNAASTFANQAIQAQFARIDVYRTAGPMSTGKVGSLTCAANVATTGSYCSAFSDTGLSASGSLPSLNTTGSVSAPLYKTNTNCAAVGTAASPSVASCSAAAAGLFSCATNASGATCVVNTTAVTANSVIHITPSAADGTALGVTCNTTADAPTGPRLAAKSAGVSFTINLGTVATNPTCYEYSIIN